MQRIQYPDAKDIAKFRAEYRNIFMRRNRQFAGSMNFAQLGTSLGRILTGNLEQLLGIIPTLDGLHANARIKRQIELHFNYENWAERIADFFMKHSELLELASCYYCNIDYINTFQNVSDYADIWDFLKNGTDEDLMTIEWVGESMAKKIRGICRTNNITSIDDLKIDKRVIEGIKNRQALIAKGKPIEVSNMRNHFTLDHVIPKGDYPLFSLSLYNLVPCCSSCNSKFKSVTPLLNGNTDQFLSPSSVAFSFDASVRFSFFSKTAVLPDPVCEKDIVLRLKYFAQEEAYRRYSKLFRLAQRYVFHKGEVVSLINKSKRYSDRQLVEISKLVGIPVQKIKEDIFGEDLFQKGKPRSLTKLRRDIARNIGILK